MAAARINLPSDAQNSRGGEAMRQTEITLGEATYQVSRVFAGQRPLSELVAECLARRATEDPAFDEGRIEDV